MVKHIKLRVVDLPYSAPPWKQVDSHCQPLPRFSPISVNKLTTSLNEQQSLAFALAFSKYKFNGLGGGCWGSLNPPPTNNWRESPSRGVMALKEEDLSPQLNNESDISFHITSHWDALEKRRSRNANGPACRNMRNMTPPLCSCLRIALNHHSLQSKLFSCF